MRSPTDAPGWSMQASCLFYDIFGKGAAFMGTMLMGISTQLSGSSRTGVGMLAVMFIIGFFLFGKTEKLERV